jgi:O-antigen ligase
MDLDGERGLRSMRAEDTDTGTRPHLAAIVAAVAAGTVAQGGFFAAGRILTTALLVAAAALAWWAGWRPLRNRSAVVFTAACGALALWGLVRAFAAGDSVDIAVAGAATLAGVVFVADAVAQEGERGREFLADSLIAVGAAVGALAWLGVAWRVPRFVELVEERVWRGAATLTYPNAAAALLAVIALLALGVTRQSAVTRMAAFLMIAGLGATLSRAGVLAFVVGLVVLAVAAGVRHTVEVAVPAGLGGAVATAALLPSVSADGQPRPGPALLGLAAGAVIAMAPVVLPRKVTPVALAAAGAAAAAGSWTLVRGDMFDKALAGRWTLESSGRSKGAGAALDIVRDNPFTGTGLGRSYLFWTTPDGHGAAARFAHNEYLQILVDLGIVGAVPLIVLIGAAIALIRRGHAHPLRAGAIAALAAFAVHSAFDFLWHIAVLPILGGALLGLAATAARRTGVQGPDAGAPSSSRPSITERTP